MSLPLEELDRDVVAASDGKAAAEIYLRLRDAILTGTFPDNTAVSQVKLASQFGVSRTPLREALRLLEREGLIESTPNRRPRVVAMSVHDLDDLYGTRIMIECLAITISTPRATQADLDDLQRHYDEMEQLAETRDVSAWEAPHACFHDVLIRHVGTRMRRSAADLRDHGRRYRTKLLGEPLAWGKSSQEHADIMAAVVDRNAVRAARLLGLHYARTALTLITNMAPEHDPVAVRGALRYVQALPE